MLSISVRRRGEEIYHEVDRVGALESNALGARVAESRTDLQVFSHGGAFLWYNTQVTYLVDAKMAYAAQFPWTSDCIFLVCAAALVDHRRCGGRICDSTV
jgi:hypothetical protein